MENSYIDTTKYYNTLGAAKDADIKEIIRNFRSLIRIHQPKMEGNGDIFDLIKKVCDVLKDSEKSRLYDIYGEILEPSHSYNQ